MADTPKMIFVLIGVLSAVMSLLFTKELIPYLKEKKAGQNIREEGPKSHMKKSGTVSMGGIAIIGTTLFTFVFSWSSVYGAYGDKFFIASWETTVILVCFILFGIIGFIDDYQKVAKKRNLGLTAKQKLILQTIVAFIFSMFEYYYNGKSGGVYIPFYREYLDIGVFYIPFLMFVIVAMVNSVNLTDGLDGLAGSNSALVLIYLGVWAFVLGEFQITNIAIIIGGSVIGFLFWNRNPAKIFMGDTGSLALGGAISMIAIAMHRELFLLVLCFVFVMETVSVILQVISFKTTGKRLFRMSPIHHHFELLGMEEKSIVYMFAVITVVGMVVTNFIM